ncbi:arsenate reductase ArsC [Asticcacaulis sp. AND118]|uniref:arsenate reductase/protein-tyrosine-phosphatase family protein n=1 Tax=Asticcacaulis sp. AND118 TaxID=2840468 RepID=UPI001D000F30|nr:arsenate reductase ArsC [Asticcacaulis sp. AND118]UDF03976.1 arsenate reductase ArsC [Asticcacaulis sp. AND118]
MYQRPIHVLFLAERNSSRSILAEALLNRLGAGRFEAWSAGVSPAVAVSPYAIALLHRINYNMQMLVPKSVEAFGAEDAPEIDFVFRLSHHLPQGRLPEFKGNPRIVDWFLPDPEDVMGSPAMIATAYADLFGALCSRIETLTQMSPAFLAGDAAEARLERMGEAYIRLAA